MLYPIGIQNFEKLREGGYTYIDKTGLIYRLVSTGTYYFLSRPRRFGKSLLTSTLESYFQGRRDLFEGLAISGLETEWNEYPVLHIDFSGVAYKASDVLGKVLDQFLSDWEALYGVAASSDLPGLRFQRVIDAACEKTGRQVVVLIDEYDKPIVDNLTEPELMNVFRSQLQGFYSVLKAKDGKVRFAFLTGVSKIGKMSVFSGLNNLRDISMLPEYSSICGISESELHSYFDESVSELASSTRETKEECYVHLKEMYDGYHFCEDSEGMYNPFSLLNTFANRKYGEYWFETGTPTLLVDVMKNTTYDITLLGSQDVTVESLNGVDSILDNPVPLFFQTGYLTVKDYEPMVGLYTLGFPNREVKDGFMRFMIRYYLNTSNASTSIARVMKMKLCLFRGDASGFMSELESFFAGISYQIQGDVEKDFQYAMYIILELVGLDVEVERTTSNGRMDMLIKTKDYIYIIEIKVDSTADAALRQIDEKGYARPFASDSRKLYRIGVSFSTATRRIEDWKVLDWAKIAD
jgi:hypothetical protein bacD2_03749